MKHKLVTIGYLGGKRAYLDIPLEAAIVRYMASEEIEEAPDPKLIDEFEFDDEFYTYEAGPLGPV